jgi:hypothetical protein
MKVTLIAATALAVLVVAANRRGGEAADRRSGASGGLDQEPHDTEGKAGRNGARHDHRPTRRQLRLAPARLSCRRRHRERNPHSSRPFNRELRAVQGLERTSVHRASESPAPGAERRDQARHDVRDVSRHPEGGAGEPPRSTANWLQLLNRLERRGALRVGNRRPRPFLHPAERARRGYDITMVAIARAAQLPPRSDRGSPSPSPEPLRRVTHCRLLAEGHA